MMQAVKPTILILTTHTGGGHLNLAQSLKSMLGTDHEVIIMDPQPALVDLWYTMVSRYFVKFLNWQFVATDNEAAAFRMQKVLALLSQKRLLSILEQVQPQLIITTHSYLSYAIARARERLGKRIPLVFQLTDLERLHMTWFTEKQADAYLAPTREIWAQALQQGIDKDRLHLTGRPVRHQFLEVSADKRSETLTPLELDPAVFTIFLQGGAKGSANVDRTIESLLRTSVPMQLILAVGNNTMMAARYSGIERVRILPFTETVAPYMAAADVVAGKAGASFISEAFMLEKPFIVTTFIPGQEAPNLHFIEQHNLGWVCLEPTAQCELFTALASNPELIAEKVESIRACKAWNMQHNQQIYPLIDQLLSYEHAEIALSTSSEST